VGSHVTVPLGGRKVKGWVTSIRSEAPERRLKTIVSVSGDLPHFDAPLLETLRWIALRHVAPVATLLARAGPPNIPRLKNGSPDAQPPAADSSGTTYVVTGGPYDDALTGICESVAGDGRNVLVVCPTVTEVERYATVLEGRVKVPVLRVGSAIAARTVTQAWTRAATTGGNVVVGTREAVLWPLGPLGGVIVIEEGRRGHTSPQTPTWTVRDVALHRAAVEGFQTWFIGPVPSVHVLAAAPELESDGKRVWPLVEVVNRFDEPPGTGPILEASIMAVRTVVKRGGSVFVLVNRRAYAPVFRCLSCKQLRRCPDCGAGVERSDECPRCGARLGGCPSCGGRKFEPVGAGVGRSIEILKRSVGDAVGPAGSDTLVTVGTERDIPAPASTDLVLIVDADGMLLAPHFRAEEEALRIMGRAAASVRRGDGNRTVVQTNQPAERVIVAIRGGRPLPLLLDILAERKVTGFPPVGEVVVVKTSTASDDIAREIATLGRRTNAVTLGPVPVQGGQRWLIQGADLHRFKLALRGVIGGWRDSGVKVRVDVDPIDL
jgi:primosomal protein N' (replication factor Y) (superfamily II helicase)